MFDCPTASDAPVSSPTEMPNSDKRDEGPELAQTRSADRIEQCRNLEAKRKTSARTEYFAFW